MVRSLWVGLALMVAYAGWMGGQEKPVQASPQTQSGQPEEATAPGKAGSREVRARRPNPDAAGKYHVGDGVSAPTLIFSAEPEFSEKARKAKLRGDCALSLTVDMDGLPKNVMVVRSIAESQPEKKRAAAISLDEKAIEAVKQYRFKPAMLDGRPVPVEMHIDVNFQIY